LYGFARTTFHKELLCPLDGPVDDCVCLFAKCGWRLRSRNACDLADMHQARRSNFETDVVLAEYFVHEVDIGNFVLGLCPEGFTAIVEGLDE
jgi:hypothetical protein